MPPRLPSPACTDRKVTWLPCPAPLRGASTRRDGERRWRAVKRRLRAKGEARGMSAHSGRDFFPLYMELFRVKPSREAARFHRCSRKLAASMRATIYAIQGGSKPGAVRERECRKPPENPCSFRYACGPRAPKEAQVRVCMRAASKSCLETAGQVFCILLLIYSRGARVRTQRCPRACGRGAGAMDGENSPGTSLPRCSRPI